MKIFSVSNTAGRILFSFLLLVFSATVANASEIEGELPPNSPQILPSPAKFCSPGGWIYVNFSQNNIDSFLWIRNGINLTNNNDSLFAGQGGTYKVVLFSNNSRVDSATTNVIVNQSPQADFSFTPTSGCGKTRVFFTDLSTSSASISTWSWNFGGGATSNQQNPTFTFRPTPGIGTQTFTITLTVVDANGCSSTKTQTITIGRGPDPTLTSIDAQVATFNGLTTFKVCSNNQSATISFINQSTTTNTNYQIRWGDNTPSFSSPTFSPSPLTHTYAIGTYTLTYIVSAGSCIDSTQYLVFIGSNPVIGITNPGGTEICSGSALTFPLNYVNGQGVTNTPGTQYTVTVNDGSPDVNFEHPSVGAPPPSITHLFDTTSCGVLSLGSNNSFYVKITASNPCGTSSAFIVPIYVSQSPEPDYSISPTSLCVSPTASQTVTFTNTGKNGDVVQAGQGLGDCSPGKQVWSISPSTGWTANTASFGSTNGFSNSPNAWTNGAGQISVNFTTPGTYSVKLLAGAGLLCGVDSIVKQVCIDSIPTAAFSTPIDTGCAPLRVNISGNTNNAVCGQNNFRYWINYIPSSGCLPNIPGYSYVNNTDSTSANPQIVFNNPGIYTINLQTSSPGQGCVSGVVSRQIVVKAPPRVNLNPFPDSLCSTNSTINPSANYSCFIDNATTYLWTVTPSASPSNTSTSAVPPAFTLPVGNSTVKIKVTNFCGSDSVLRPVVVKQLPSATINYLNGGSFCNNVNTLQNISFSGSAGGSYTSNPAGLSLNNTTGAILPSSSNPGTYTVTYTIPASGGCPAVTATTTVTITAAFSATISYNSSFCNTVSTAQNIILSGTTGGTFSALPAGLSINPNTGAVIPSSSTPGTYTISYQIPASGGCAAFSAQTTLVINPQPTINGPDSVCQGASITLSGSPIPNPNNPWTSLNNNIATVSGTGVVTAVSTGSQSVASVTIRYTNSFGCSKDTSIRVNPLPVISGPASVCINESIQLSGSGTAAASNPWTSSNAAVATVTGTGQVTGVTAGTADITYRNSSGCQKTQTVTVNPIPVIAGTKVDPTQCATNNGSITITGLVVNSTYTLNYEVGGVSAAPVTFNSGTATSYTISNLGAGNYTNITVTRNGCRSNPLSFSLSAPSAPPAPSVNNDTVLCSGGTINLSASTSATGNATFRWVGPGGFVSTNPNPVINNATVAASGVYSVTVTINNCTSPAATVNVEVKQTPNNITASSNSPVCTGNPLNLSANITGATGLVWSWTGPGNFTSSDEDPQVSTSATVAMAGTYSVTATAVYTIPVALNCTSAAVTTLVDVRPTPSITGNLLTDPTNCATATGSIRLEGLTPNTSYQVTYTGTATQTLTISSNAAGYVIIPTLTQGTYSNIFVSLNGCPSAPVGPFDLVDPNPPSAPVINSNSPICEGETLNLTATTSAVNASFSWTGPGGYTSSDQNPSISNAPLSAAGVYSLTITVNSCTSPAATTNVVINARPATPVVTSPIDYCQFATTTALSATALPLHNLFWYTAASGGTGVATAPVPSSSSPGTTTYYVSQETPEQCEGNRAPIVVIINPTPVLTPQAQTICSSQSFNITPSGSGVPAGTSYSWAAPVVTGGLTNGAAGTSQASIAGTLNNPTDNVQTATYTVNPQTGNCPGNPFQVVITVNPAPRVEFAPAADQIICSGQTTQSVNLSSPSPGVSITWNATSPAGVTGNNTGGGTTLIPAQQLFNNTSSSATIVYSATAITGGTQGCPGSTTTYNITINPTPEVPDEPLVICSGDNLNWVPVNAPPAVIVPTGTTYTWTFTDNPLVTGETAASTAQNSFTQQLVNESNAPQNVIYTVTPQSGTSGDCTGQPFQVTVTINPKPELPTYYDTICSGNDFTITPVTGQAFSDTTVPAGTLYSWPVPQMPAGVSGGVAASSQSNISGTLVNNTFVPLDVVYTVTPVAGNCPGDPFEVRITVNPLASISNNPPSQSVCNGGTTQPVTWTSFTAGASYGWTLISTGNTTGALPSGSGPVLNSMQLTNTGVTQEQVVYEVTSTASACPGPPTPYIIYVNPDASASFTFVKDTACWPFNIQINNTSPQTADSGYYWYANNVLIGTGYNFPGYTINDPDDFIDITLKTISRYGCVDDTLTHRFYTYNKPDPEFTVSFAQPPCAPLLVSFNNQTAGNTPNPIAPFRYYWQFGNFATSDVEQPDPVVFNGSWSRQDTTYLVILSAFNECDTVRDTMEITVSSGPKAQFAPDQTNICSNTSVVFTNTSRGNGNIYSWDFGDGSPVVTTPSSNSVSHVYNVGVDTTFRAILRVENECGTDSFFVFINVTPSTITLNWFVVDTTQNGCAPHQVTLTNVSVGGNSFTWNFGDGTAPYTSLSNNEIITHTYTIPGVYYIQVEGSNNCTDTTGIDTVRVIRSPLPNFSIINNNACPGTAVQFSNLTDVASSYTWNFGDPASGISNTSGLPNPSHVYREPGTFIVTLTATLLDSASGESCPAQVQLPVNVIAPVANIIAPATGCVAQTIIFEPIVNLVAGLAPIQDTTWLVNGVPFGMNPQYYPNFSHVFSQPGSYTVSLIVSTVDGCKDTITTNISISSLPSIEAGPDKRICRGNSETLLANSSENNYQWSPANTLSCNNCANPSASPLVTTLYTVTTQNSIGCSNKDSVLVTVIQPFTMTASPNDTICANQSTTLSANGADNYTWNPANTLSCSTCPNPVATPATTTTYTVTGYDNFNCFSEVRTVTVAVGQYPIITMPPGQTLATGDTIPITPVYQNGPFNNNSFQWTPKNDLNCDSCSTVVATIKKDLCYSVIATNIYGCADTGQICFRAICDKTQVYIPNAFTPGRNSGPDIYNNRFWVRSKGVGLIKTFRVFNRWGEVVFEKYNYKPFEQLSSSPTMPPPEQGWDGNVKGKPANSDVYVYVVEAVCENGTPFFYKGNVTLIR